MKSRSLLQLAVAIAIGVEQLSYSLAFEVTGDFELPFRIPFNDTFGVIQRSFPIQTKYLSEILPAKPVLQEKEKPEADRIGGNPSVKIQHEVHDPRAEVKNITSKAKKGRFRYQLTLAIEGGEGRTIRHRKTGYLTPSRYNVDVENIQSLLKNIVEIGKEIKCVPLGYVDSQNAEKRDEMQYPILYRSSPNARYSFERMDNKRNLHRQERIGRLTRNNYLHNLRKAYQKHDEADDDAKELQTTESSFPKEATEEPKLTESRVHIYSPILRHSSQRMDHTGNLYQHEGIRPLPITYRSYYPHKPMNTLLKQDGSDENSQKPKILEYSFSKKIPENPQTTKSGTTDDTFNEVFKEEPNKLVDTPVYPIKFKSFNFNIEPPVFGIDNEENSKENSAKSYDPMKTEVKYSKLEESEPRSYNIKESDSGSIYLKSSESKDPNFDEDNTENVKMVDIVQPQTKVFQDSVDIPSKESETQMSDIKELDTKNSDLKSSESKQPNFDEDDTEGVKRIVVIQPEIKVVQDSVDIPSTESETKMSDINESGTTNSDLKSSESKQPNFDEDDTEDVKRIVVIQPEIKVVQDSVDIPSTESEAKMSHINEYDIKNSDLKSSELKQPNFDEDDTEGVKRIGAIQPEIKVVQDSVDIPSTESEAKMSDINEYDIKNSDLKSSELKQPNFDEDDTEGVKRIVAIQPEIKVVQDSVDIPSTESEAKMSHINEYDIKNSDLKSSELKQPNFDEDDTEDVKKVVVIQPQTKVVNDLVDIPQQEFTKESLQVIDPPSYRIREDILRTPIVAVEQFIGTKERLLRLATDSNKTCLLAWLSFARKIDAQGILQKNPVQIEYRPFEFAYQSNDGEGTTQHRKEIADEKGAVKGSYGFTDQYGMYRTVDYIADNHGFRAVIKSNEPSTANMNPADAVWMVQTPPESVPSPSNAQIPIEDSYPSVQRSSANYTPEVSSSAVSNALLSSLQFALRGHQHPYPRLVSNQEPILILSDGESYGQRSLFKFLSQESEYKPQL
ncbi:hypothetical protein JTE90_008052 [Oedothorax gibbosus]|uniref:Uncharacterized protein n=1 Tax=Oedothorax gibbosus TaxID=931172 RepID=A0AAV6UVW1_9ARAC|nr:hypothetical protein JTE90_008052 [Oedothorax gibbosus]